MHNCVSNHQQLYCSTACPHWQYRQHQGSARFMGPTWGPFGADKTEVGPMLAPRTLLSGALLVLCATGKRPLSVSISWRHHGVQTRRTLAIKKWPSTCCIQINIRVSFDVYQRNHIWWRPTYSQLLISNAWHLCELTLSHDSASPVKSFWLLGTKHLLELIMITSSNGSNFGVTGLCAGNSPVTGEFPTQRPVTRSFDVFFDLRVNKRLSKQSWGWWFETSPSSLWRRCNG